MGKTVLSVGALLILVLVALFACDRTNQRSEAEAKSFCESLIPQIEGIKHTTGKFPEKLDPSWLRGKALPRLIDSQRFYSGHDDFYDFHFRNPRRLNGLFVFDYQHKVWLNGD
jgi:hypothetical protein